MKAPGKEKHGGPAKEVTGPAEENITPGVLNPGIVEEENQREEETKTPEPQPEKGKQKELD